MSETKFTAGPWQVFRKQSSVGCNEGQGIAELWRDGDERKANANLIAAAPEMYAMLEQICDGMFDAESAQKLLAKARGDA